MASYKVEWKQSAARELRKLEKETISAVVKAVEALSEEPYPAGSRKLKGSVHSYRIRVGDYRVIYSMRESELTVEIIRVGHRRDIYRRLLLP
ncbi:MAG: type II toxin-antitoxin system RelE/ParE family toxin [Pseudomonadota bacterium]